jgi:hypothetical protein
MNTDQWGLIVQAATAAISLGGLVAVVISLQQVNRSLKANAVAKMYDEIHEVHRVFIDHPDLRPVFFNDARIDGSDANYLRCRGIAEMFLDIFEHVYRLRGQAFENEQANWLRYIRHMCDSSGFLCSYLQENIELIEPRELRELILHRISARATRTQSLAEPS